MRKNCFLISDSYSLLLKNVCFTKMQVCVYVAFQAWRGPVAYAENFHGGFGTGSYGDHLYLVRAVCDVTK